MRALATERLALEPLEVAHADELYDALSDERLYEFLDGEPPTTLEALRERYGVLARRRSPDGREAWLNWILRRSADGASIGYVQATLPDEGPATIGYVLVREAWGRGLAREAVAELVRHLFGEWSISVLEATVDLSNQRSIALLEALGFERVRVEGGDARYRRQA